MSEFDVSMPDDFSIECVTVTLVENLITIVRGFAGFDEIFINADHFRRKFDSFDGTVEQLRLLAKMDIISVTLHELAHVMIRKVRMVVKNRFPYNNGISDWRCSAPGTST